MPNSLESLKGETLEVVKSNQSRIVLENERDKKLEIKPTSKQVQGILQDEREDILKLRTLKEGDEK